MKRWQELRVSNDGTYHTRGGAPAYAARFLEVLNFHPPGLAAARGPTGAFHIDTDGTPAYAVRFRRSFGFYERRAAVVAGDGAFHILPDACDAYPARFAWCGNYQEGQATVRATDGRYHHIDIDGRSAYADRWLYAGDFHDGAAVVQADDGRSTHIDRDGRFLHGRWFVDLDVFHKGFARARDDDGWMHVDRGGRPIYGRRFAAVEPFYNGQARVERPDGGLEVIDESGGTIVELRPALRSEFEALSADLVGFWRTRTIATAVELGVFEALPGTTGDIAARCGLPPDGTVRLLRALAELRLVDHDGDRWETTPRSRFLRPDDPLTLADAAREYGGRLDRLWQGLPKALRGSSRRQATAIFDETAADPNHGASHHRMLRSYARHDYAAVPEALDLRGDELVIDAGGGVGVLAEALLRRHPGLRVVLLERPEVIRQVDLPGDVRERLQTRAADLFEPWGVSGDAVVFSRVLHDWDDERARVLLRRAHAALPAGGRGFIIEMLLPEGGGFGGLCDLHLLAVTGGRERTGTEYGDLLRATGFEPHQIVRLPALPSVVVGVRP
ncbi:MAG: methyltransferase [Myxococcota bacterium]|nr:methyltransferase [Myxococcota bacterium]